MAGDNGGTITVQKEVLARALLASKLGMSYSGKRDIYKALGYDETLTYEMYAARYARQDIAATIINKPAEATWRGPLRVVESDDEEETSLELQWKELNEALDLKSKFLRADKLSGLGQYAVLLLGLDDVSQKEQLSNPVDPNRENKLKYIKPFGEGHAQIERWESRTNNPRYGLPSIYKLTVMNPGANTNTELRVHHSRVIHIARELLESEVEGVPTLKRVYNSLQDIEKLVGGSAEMFWRGARPGMQAKVNEGYEGLDPSDTKELQKQMDEYEHDLRRMFSLSGVDLETLSQQVSDPSNHFDIQIQMISAFTGIPKRMLTGSERGELSSSQDRTAWLEMIQGRREEFAEQRILHPFIKRCQEYKILEESEDYYIEWQDLFAPSEKEQADVGKTRAEALKAFTESGAENVLSFEQFLEYFIKLNKEQISQIKEYRDNEIEEEQEFNEQNPEEE